MVPRATNDAVPAALVLEAALHSTAASSASTGTAFAGAVHVVNRGPLPARFSISSDGHLFRDKDDMLAYIAMLPPMYEGEPDYRKAWRFLTARAYFYTPYTGSDEQHDPLRFVNSLGYGYCDDFASVLATIWQWQGYESRVWWMTGHVVPEIKVNDRWMMFDADMGVYYVDTSSEPASVEELAANPQLIFQPIDPAYDASYVAYEPLIADIYASTQNNRAKAPAMGDSRGMQIELPAGSDFAFPVANASDPWLFGDATLSHPLYYGAELRVPAVAQDTELRLPLFVTGISGGGQVQIGDQTYDIGSVELDARFVGFWIPDSYTEPVSTVTLRAGANAVVIRMSLSPFVIDGSDSARVRIAADEMGVPVEAAYIPSAIQAESVVTAIISEADRRLQQGPLGYSSPQIVFSELSRSLSQ
jgi:hypothetical protein